MKCLIIIPLALLLGACGNWLGVPENIDVSGEVSITQPAVMLKGGKLYIIEHAGELVVDCLVYDENVLLPEGERLDLEAANSYRTIPSTEAELINCL